MFGNLGNSQTLAVKITGDSSQLQSAASGAIGSLMNMKTAVMAVGAALTTMAAKSVSASAELEQAMADVEAMSGATADEMAILRGEVESLGKSTRFMVTDIANAEKQLSKFGLTAREVQNSLPGIVDAAAASGNKLEQTSRNLIQVTKGYDMAVSQTSKVADVFAEAQRSSGASIQSLTRAFQDIGPIMSAMGKDIEFTTALLGKLADRGIEAGRAGRMLRAAYSQWGEMQVGEFTKKQVEAIERLGMTTSEVATMDFMQFIDRLGEAGATYGDFATIFTRRSSTVLTILSQLGGGLDELEQKLRESGGAAREVAETRLDTLSGQTTVLKGSLQLLQSSFGNTKGVIKDFLKNSVIPTVNSITDFVKQGRSLGDALLWFKDIVKETKETVAALSPIFRGIADAIKITMDALWTTVDTVLTGVKGLFVSLMQYLQGDWNESLETLKDTVVTILKNIGKFIRRTLDTILGYFGTSTKEVLVTITKWGERMVKLTIGVMGRFAKPVRAGLNTASDFMETALQDMLTALAVWGSDSIESMRNIFEQIGNTVKNGLNTVIGFFDNSLSRILEKMAGWGDTLVNNLSSTLEPFVNTFINAINKIISGWNAIPEAIKPGGDVEKLGEFGGFETDLGGKATEFGISKIKGQLNLEGLMEDQLEWLKGIQGKIDGLNIPELSEVDLSVLTSELGWEEWAQNLEFEKLPGYIEESSKEGTKEGAKEGTKEGQKLSPSDLPRGVAKESPGGGTVKPIWEGYKEWWKGFKKSIDTMKQQNKVFGDEFDLTSNLLSKYRSGIKKLLEEGYRPSDKELKKLIKRWKELSQSSVNLKEKVNNAGNAMLDVANSLADVARSTGKLAPGEGAKISGITGAASAALSGNWLQAGLSLFTGFMKARIEKLKAQAKELRERIDAAFSILEKGIRSFGNAVNKLAGDLLGPFGAALSGVTSSLTSFFGMIRAHKMGNTLEMVKAGFEGVMNVVNGLISTFSNLINQSEGYKALQSELEPIWETISNALGQLLMPLAALVSWVTDFLGIAEKTNKEVSEFGQVSGMKRARKKWRAATPGQGARVSEGGPTIPEWAKQIIAPLKNYLKPVLSDIKSRGGLGEMITRWVRDLWKKFMPWLTEKIPSFLNAIDGAINWLKREVNWDEIWQGIKGLVKFFAKGFGPAWDAFTKELPGLLGGVLGEDSALIKELKQINKNLVQLAKAMGAGAKILGGMAVGAAVGGAIGGLPGAVIGGIIGGVGGALFDEGGIATEPTLGMVAESGPEAVIPLDQADQYLGGGQPIIIEHKTQIDGKTIYKSVKKYEEKDNYAGTGSPAGGGHLRG